MLNIKKGIVLLLGLFSLTVSAQTIQSESIITDGKTRTYRIYVPEVYDGSREVPLIFNFHGYGSTNWQQEIYGDFRPIADTANFIIVHPQGSALNGSTGWNNFTTIDAAHAEINFIKDLIDTLSNHYNIDYNRIYSTGMSNGGFMSYDLACFFSTRIAAIASVTGSMVSLHKDACNPERPVPVLQIHGTADQMVTFNGSGGLIPSLHIDSLISFWNEINNIISSPVITTLPDINIYDYSTVEHHLYTGGTAGNTVEFYKVINGGHTWPGSMISTGSGNTNRDFNASAAIWNFFRQYSLNGNTIVTVIEEPKDDPFKIYGSPAGNEIILKLTEPREALLKIFNTSGALIYEGVANNTHNGIQLNGPAGIYFYQLKIQDRGYSGKIAVY